MQKHKERSLAGLYTRGLHGSSLLAAWFIVLLICNFPEPTGLLGQQVFAACPRCLHSFIND